MRSRRDRFLARWVCDRTGVAELEAYLGEMIDIRMADADVNSMIAKILADVRSPGKDLDEMLTASAMRDFASPP